MKQTVAKIISYSLDPSLMWPFFVLLVLVGTGLNYDEMKELFIPLFLIELFAPVALLGYFHHIGKVSDWEMTDVKERRLFFTVVAAMHVFTVLVLYMWGTELAWQIRLAVLIIEVIGTGVTFFWKISIHLAAFTMVVLTLNVLFGWQWWPLFLLIPVLMWARVVRKKHTIMQTVIGASFTVIFMLALLLAFGIPLA